MQNHSLLTIKCLNFKSFRSTNYLTLLNKTFASSKRHCQKCLNKRQKPSHYSLTIILIAGSTSQKMIY